MFLRPCNAGTERGSVMWGPPVMYLLLLNKHTGDQATATGFAADPETIACAGANSLPRQNALICLTSNTEHSITACKACKPKPAAVGHRAVYGGCCLHVVLSKRSRQHP